MVGVPENGIGGRQFHHASQVHDSHTIRNVADDAEIVADEKIGQVQFRAQCFEQVQHLGLDRYIQRRDGFIANDDGRLERQGPRNADALPLAARELMGITL
ncbi:hypothetical protein D9M69_559300 [compost metagenome]